MSESRTARLDSPDMRARYGVGRRRPWLRVLGVAGAAAAVGLLGWLWSQPRVSGALDGYRIVSDDHVDITFTVSAEEPATCYLRAFDIQSYDLGYAELPVEATEGTVRITYPLRTISRPVGAALMGCRGVTGGARIEDPNWRPGVTPPKQPWTP